jgi:hypothetical protein
MTSTDLQTLEPVFLFRGTRTYLHSSTVFDYLRGFDSQPEQIDFTVHKMTGQQCVVLPEPPPARGEPLIATYRSAGLTRFLYETDRAMQGSYPCNEREICQQARFGESAGSFAMPPIPSASYIEAAVGVYKHLLQLVYPQETRKLLFARMTLTYVPADGLCRVEHRRKIGADFLESRLFHNGRLLGKLIFGLL